MKRIISLNLPEGVMGLIGSKTPRQAFEGLVKNNGIPILELRTFGMVVTDIYWIKTGETHHHVTCWEGGQVTVTKHHEKEGLASLIAIETWEGESHPDGGQCMEIFSRHVSGY